METNKRIAIALLLLVWGTLKIDAAKEVALTEPSSSSALVAQPTIAMPKKEVKAMITAYSSRQEETDSTPYLTASGTLVRPGVVAANWLPLGTRLMIPEVFGDRVFVVEDRMHYRNNRKVDVWFPKTQEALNFGTKIARVQVL